MKNTTKNVQQSKSVVFIKMAPIFRTLGWNRKQEGLLGFIQMIKR